MSLRRFLHRHRAELGRPLLVQRNRYGIGTVLGVFFVWFALCALFAVNPEMSAGAVLASCALVTLAAVVLLVMLAGEVLVVCEAGLVMGTAGVMRTPFIIRYDQITPGSVVPVHRSRLYPRTTGRRGWTSTVRNPAWNNQGVHLVGPSPAEALRGARRRTAGATYVQGRSIDGRWIWFAGTGSTPPEQVTSTIAQAAHGAGCSELARRTSQAPPRELTGKLADRDRLLPGYPPYGR